MKIFKITTLKGQRKTDIKKKLSLKWTFRGLFGRVVFKHFYISCEGAFVGDA